LARLTELKTLELAKIAGVVFPEGEIRELAKCSRLQEIKLVNSSISVFTLTTLIRSCPELSRFETLATPDNYDPSEILYLLTGLGQRRITIAFCCFAERVYRFRACFWAMSLGDGTGQMLKEMEETEGLVISIEMIPSYEDNGQPSLMEFEKF